MVTAQPAIYARRKDNGQPTTIFPAHEPPSKHNRSVLGFLTSQS